jgi:hypothetical protein
MQISAWTGPDDFQSGVAAAVGNLSEGVISATCLLVSRRALQFFFVIAIVFAGSGSPLRGALSDGQIYAFNFADVDGHTLSTADGHVTVIVLATRSNTAKAHEVGDRVPDYCLGNPTYRMITVVNFDQKRTRLGRSIATMLVRRRLDAEAKALQRRYDAKNMARDARSDIFAVTDFDGKLAAQLGAQAGSADFLVLVFDRDGKLLRQWSDVPSAEELATVVK